MAQELFASAVRGRGDLAGAFEYDGRTAYFYLYDQSRADGQRVVDSIHVFSGGTDLKESDVAVRWDERGERVALFLRGAQWAVFNSVTGRKFGGSYRDGGAPSIPPEETVGKLATRRN